jgi:hypothetical protein
VKFAATRGVGASHRLGVELVYTMLILVTNYLLGKDMAILTGTLQ